MEHALAGRVPPPPFQYIGTSSHKRRIYCIQKIKVRLLLAALGDTIDSIPCRAIAIWHHDDRKNRMIAILHQDDRKNRMKAILHQDYRMNRMKAILHQDDMKKG